MAVPIAMPPDPTEPTDAGAPVDPNDATCPCGHLVTVPWRRGSGFLSPASVICGVLIVALGAVGASAGVRPAAGWAILGALAVIVLGSIVVQFVRGHRGTCALARGAWIGLAVPGLPLRVALSFAV